MLDYRELSIKIRVMCLKMIYTAREGHIGSSLSCVDILISLYFDVMKIDVNRPRWIDRDRFVLSKGHAAPALYVILAIKGFFPLDTLKTFRQYNSILQGHPDMTKTPGIDMSSGSLGNGLACSVGMALWAKKKQ